MVEYPESNLVIQTACPKCPSSDAYSLYDDGHGYCYSCGHRSVGNNDIQKPQENFMQIDLIQGGEISPLRKRGIHLDTTTKFKYEVGSYKGKTCQIANYIKDGSRVAQKIRFPNKDFLFIGDTKQVGLYGQWLFNGGGRMVVCCEGEIDTLTVSQVFGNKYPVVGVPTGAQGAKKAIQKNLEWLCKYETVVFAFDMDKPGQDAALECAALLPPGMAKIAHLEMKDPNDMLKAGKVKQLSGAIWEAKTYQPDGILNGKDLWEMVSTEDKTESKAYPYEGLNRMTRGIRKNEIVTVTAGSGIGKSQLVREMFHHLLIQGETVGYIALEENVKRTALGLMSLAINKPLHLGTQHVTEEELKVAFDSTLGTGRVYLYDHWGSTETDNLLNKIRYLATTGGCGYIALDHISICVSGLEGGDERRIIDNLMTHIRSLCEELSIGIVLVSHLKRPAGDKGHEDGAKTTLAQLRGSASIGQLSDIVVGCERDQQSMDHGDITTVRILKNRWTGETGVCSMLKYDRVTGRMTEMMLPDVEEPEAGSPFENMDIEEEQAWS